MYQSVQIFNSNNFSKILWNFYPYDHFICKFWWCFVLLFLHSFYLPSLWCIPGISKKVLKAAPLNILLPEIRYLNFNVGLFLLIFIYSPFFMYLVNFVYCWRSLKNYLGEFLWEPEWRFLPAKRICMFSRPLQSQILLISQTDV